VALSAHGSEPDVVRAGVGFLQCLASHADNTAALLAEVPLVCASAGPHVVSSAVTHACSQFIDILEVSRRGRRVMCFAAALSDREWPAGMD
jgi:hypothetical protein